MKKNLTIVLLSLLTSIAYSQKVDIKINSTDIYSNERLNNDFVTKNTDLFNVTYTANTNLTFGTDISKVFKIEGISTKFAGKGKVTIQVNNSNLGVDTTFTFTSNLSVSNKYEIEDKLIEAFINNADGSKGLANNINTYLSKSVSKNCDNVIKKAEQELNNKNWKEAYRKAVSVSNSNCKKEAQSIIDKVELAYGEEFCNEKLTRIKVLANSGIEYKMELAVDELYRMPSKAKCKDEAILISKQIGEYLLKKNNGSTKVLNLNQVILKGNSLDSIFSEE